MILDIHANEEGRRRRKHKWGECFAASKLTNRFDASMGSILPTASCIYVMPLDAMLLLTSYAYASIHNSCMCTNNM